MLSPFSTGFSSFFLLYFVLIFSCQVFLWFSYWLFSLCLFKNNVLVFNTIHLDIDYFIVITNAFLFQVCENTYLCCIGFYHCLYLDHQLICSEFLYIIDKVVPICVVLKTTHCPSTISWKSIVYICLFLNFLVYILSPSFMTLIPLCSKYSFKNVIIFFYFW